MIPKNVEFTNVEDEPIKEDQLDSILEETIKQRKLDLENIVSKDKSNKNKNDLINEKKQVKWAENIETNIDDIKEPPATNTNIDNNSDINILSKFKTKDSNRNSDITVIEKIVILEKKISEFSDVVKSIEKNINILMNNQLDNSNNKILSPTFKIKLLSWFNSNNYTFIITN